MSWVIEIDIRRREVESELEKLRGQKNLMVWIQVILLEYQLKRMPVRKESIGVPKC